jgi:hypothetical protein
MLKPQQLFVCVENLMHPVFQKSLASSRLIGMALLATVCIGAQAESAQGLRQRVYQQDRQLCLSGQSHQSQQTCLREAGAARQQNMAAQTQASAEQMEANALQRCQAFSGDARQSCVSRMQGQGSVQGSAAAGGILRELTEPAQ